MAAQRPCIQHLEPRYLLPRLWTAAGRQAEACEGSISVDLIPSVQIKTPPDSLSFVIRLF